MKRVLSLVLVLVMAAALFALPAAAEGAPSVASVTCKGKDVAATPVPSDGEIIVTFDREMDKDSDASIYIKDKDNISLVVAAKHDGDRSFAMSLRDVPDGEYTLHVDADAKASDGAKMGKAYQVKFKVVKSTDPPSVASVTFHGTDLAKAEVTTSGEIVVKFDRVMDKDTEGEIYIKNNAGVSEIAVAKHDGDRSFAVSYRDMPKGEYTLYVDADAKASDGTKMGKQFQMKFKIIASGEDFGEQCPSEAFTDVDRSDTSWYHSAVDWAVTRDPVITDGLTKTSFGPKNPCERCQVVTFLWRAAKCPEPTIKKNPFTDVKESDYFYKAVLWAYENKITDGLSEKTFGPKETCTREQFVTFLWRFEDEPLPNLKECPFKDVSQNFAYKAILWAYENKITDGETATTFAPQGLCTRAHVVTFLYRDLFKNKPA